MSTNGVYTKWKYYEKHPNQFLGGAKTFNSAIKIMLFLLLCEQLPKARSRENTIISEENYNSFLKIYPAKREDVQGKDNDNLYTHDIFRIKRSTKERELIRCPLSKEKLLGVKSGIQTTNCELGETESDNCIGWLTLIQCGTAFLKRKVEGSENDEIRKWELLYKNIIFRYENEGEKVRDSLPEGLVKEFGIVRVDLEKIGTLIEDLKRNSVDNNIKMCIENIRNGNIDKAVDYFKKVKKNSVLVDIINSTYSNQGGLEIFKNIVDFGKALPTCSQNTIVYVSLFDQIKTKDILNSSHILKFHKEIGRCLRNSSIDMTLTAKIEEMFKSWGKSIRNLEYSDITPFLKENYHYVRGYYPQIIERAYANKLEYFENILLFIGDSPFIEDQCVLLDALFNNMKSNNHLNSYETLKLAYRLKEVMETQNYSKANEYYKNKAEALKNSIFPSVKGLIWNGKRCTIKNKRWGEYLYAAADDLAYDSERRRVFAWRDRSYVSKDYWSVQAARKVEHFVISSVAHKECLYAAADDLKYDGHRRRVFTWRPGSPCGNSGRWRLKPVDDGRYFSMLNIDYGEYLYEANNDFLYDENRARVFTWAGWDKHVVDNTMKWEIRCKEDGE